MKFPAILLAVSIFSLTATAQKNGLINSGAVIKEGARLYDSSFYKKALVELNKVNRSDTNYVWALYEKALTCQADSQYTQAIAYCKEGLALKERRDYEPEIYNTYGNTLSAAGQLDEAIRIFDIAITKYPHYSLLYFNKGVVMIKKEKPHEAELLFQKTILMDPYMYSAHYQLALAALQQGKLVPAFLSCVGYLLMTPEGRYFSKSVNMLSGISGATDEILEFKNKRKEAPDANYQMMEDIVLSKIAADKQYKPIIALDDILSRQIQVVFEKLEYDDTNNDFWIQYYLPYYKQVYKDGKFELFINHAFSNANVEMIKAYNKKNKKELDAFTDAAADYFNTIRATNELMYKKRDTVTKRYAFDSGTLAGRGVFTNNGKTLIGHWDFYYPAGNLKSSGEYNPAGKRQGPWTYYTETGKIRSKENYLDGKLQGDQYYYYSNGNPSSHEVEASDLLEGPATTYYYNGSKKMDAGYKGGKKAGEERLYYDNGNLKAINNYVNGELRGEAKTFYKSGGVKEVGQYIGGKTEGLYRSYSESGTLSTEMHFIKDKVEGEWRSFYPNGKIKEKRNYINDQEDGLHQEYYDNEQLAVSYTSKKGKVNGESVGYSKDGRIYTKFIYDNGVLRSVKYLEPRR